jgi:hypothetical protein
MIIKKISDKSINLDLNFEAIYEEFEIEFNNLSVISTEFELLEEEKEKILRFYEECEIYGIIMVNIDDNTAIINYEGIDLILFNILDSKYLIFESINRNSLLTIISQ